MFFCKNIDKLQENVTMTMLFINYKGTTIMINKKVYIGMRTYNSSETVSDSLKSVYDQTYPNIKIVVYDDKSTDNTIEILKSWQKKFADKGIVMDIVPSEQKTNEGCGKAGERLNKIIASQIGDNDIYMGLDSDDVFLSTDTVKNCVRQMSLARANILIAGYTIQGDESLVINDKGGAPHNNLSHKLAEQKAVTINEMPEIASTADSIGWTRVLQGNIFKRYVNMYPECPKEMNVCEDFPTLAMFLFKDAKITGLKDNAYGYYKHIQSSTAQIVQKEAFSVVRLGFLNVLQNMHKTHPEEFIAGADKYINSFIEKKYAVIGNIVDKKSKEGYLLGYNRQDFERDFKEKIDCSALNLSRYLEPAVTPSQQKNKDYSN